MKSATLLVLFSTVALSQATRIPTVTRTVKQFGALERQLADANNEDAIAKLLADDFEERLCSEPGTPVARIDWLTSHSPDKTKLSQEAVHFFGDTAIYSALRSAKTGNEMIVDTWRHAGANWKLAVRYRCPATGEKPPGHELPKRY